MSEPVRAVLVGDGPFGDGVAAALGVPVQRIAASELEHGLAHVEVSPHGLVWLHLVPSASADAADPLAEAGLLLRSASAARDAGQAGGVPVTFVAVLPSPGSFTGPARIACDMAHAAMTAMMGAEIGTWSSGGRRIVGIVYAGIEGNAPAGQRPLEEIRLRTPMGVLGTFEQLADALRYVGSPRATYVTGTFLRVDGGSDAYSWVYPTRTI